MTHPQAGILNRPPDHLLVVALKLTGAGPAADAVEALRALVHHELRSQLDQTTPASPKDQPSAETGELGFDDGYDRYHLTITVAFAQSAYDKLGIARTQQPQDLEPIPWQQLGDLPGDGSKTVEVQDNGDLLLQICSDSIYINEHVLRRVEHDLASQFQIAWVMQGAQRHTSRAGRTNRREGRALTGFLDGTSNLDPKNSPDDAKLVFVDPGQTGDYPPVPTQQVPIYGGPTPPQFPSDLRQPPASEPDWTKGGSYVVVRGSVVDMSRWDPAALGEQEHVVGRWKVSGSGLDHADDPTQPPAEPDFAADPNGQTTPFTAHIRKANPRSSADDAKRRIFRRGYPLVTASTGGLRRGLVFVCFGRTISTQFEFITRAWTANPNFPVPGAGEDAFRAFESAVLAGGYFFVPPLAHPAQPWSWVLPS